MSRRIIDVLDNPKFENISYYFHANNFIYIEELDNKAIDSLLFVPGVSNELFAEIKDILTAESNDFNYKSSTKVQNSTVYLNANSTELEDQEKILINEYCETKIIDDNLIEDVYRNIPRGKFLIDFCNKKNKKYMSEVDDLDFDQLINEKGLGFSSLENLRNFFYDYNLRGESFASAVVFGQVDEILAMPLSARAKNCLKSENINSLSQLLILNQNDLLRMPNMGNKTCNEVIQFIEMYNIYQNENSNDGYHILKNINIFNAKIEVEQLHYLSIKTTFIRSLLNEGIYTLKDIMNKQLNSVYYRNIKILELSLSKPIFESFVNELGSLNENYRVALIERSNGSTLEEAGQALGVTRERVRQIVKKAVNKLMKYIDLISSALFEGNYFCSQDISNIFNNSDTVSVFKHIATQSNYVGYLSFCDKFYKKDHLNKDILVILDEITNAYIGEGVNFYDNLELIENALNNETKGIIDFTDFMSYLLSKKYTFFGDYVSKGSSSYGLVCYDAIFKYFNFDIKLDSNEDNTDIIKLRDIISKHYQGIKLPPSNRALTAAITRHSDKFILSDRGRYCPIEKIHYNMSLMDEITDYVIKHQQSSFYYSELFEVFKDRLISETNMSNFHFLHGILKMIYINEFQFERDLLTKTGEERIDTDSRINSYLLERKRPVTKEEIKKILPGINDFVISFAVMRNPKFILWENNIIHHIDNLNVEKNDLSFLEMIILKSMEKTQGYTNDALVYRLIQTHHSDFLKKHKIENAKNLFNLLSYYLSETFRFKRPHIVKSDFKCEHLNTVNIHKKLFNINKELSYNLFLANSKVIEWSDSTINCTFYELQKDYIRISADDYLLKEEFSVSNESILNIEEILNYILNGNDFVTLSDMINFERFPEIGYEWNIFILESIISEFNVGHKLIYPKVRDKRNPKGLLVNDSCKFSAYDEIIVHMLEEDRIKTISEERLRKYLQLKGVIVNVLPQELFSSDLMEYRNEVFHTLK